LLAVYSTFWREIEFLEIHGTRVSPKGQQSPPPRQPDRFLARRR
jgi:hypothetical protein